jgi:hypothetical protein
VRGKQGWQCRTRAKLEYRRAVKREQPALDTLGDDQCGVEKVVCK